MTRIHAYDLALNHGACIELVDGDLANFWLVTDRRGVMDLAKEHGIYMPKPDSDDRLEGGIKRLAFWKDFLVSLTKKRKPDYVGIEDYALDGGSHGAHYKGELGGVARMVFWTQRIPMRLHDPGSVKMFSAHKGNAGKPEVEAAVRDRWGHDFRAYNCPPSARATAKTQPHTDAGEDLSDAFSIAQLVWAEVRLRRGEIRLSDLGHEKEIQVFQRCTKAFPTSLLAREWIVNKQGTK